MHLIDFKTFSQISSNWTWPELGDMSCKYFYLSSYKKGTWGSKRDFLKVTEGSRTKHCLLTHITLLSNWIMYARLEYNQDSLFPGQLSWKMFPSPKSLSSCLISAKPHILSHFFLADIWFLQYEDGDASPEKRKSKGTFSGGLSEDTSS